MILRIASIFYLLFISACASLPTEKISLSYYESDIKPEPVVIHLYEEQTTLSYSDVMSLRKVAQFLEEHPFCRISLSSPVPAIYGSLSLDWIVSQQDIERVKNAIVQVTPSVAPRIDIRMPLSHCRAGRCVYLKWKCA